MAIDDPLDALERQYPPEDGEFTDTSIEIASSLVGLAIPAFGALSPLFKFISNLAPNSRKNRADTFIRLLLQEFRRMQSDVKKLKTDADGIRKAAQIAFHSDVSGFDDAKRERFIRIIATAAVSDTPISDLSSFIQDVVRLNEHDIMGLKVLNLVMNKEGDWKTPYPGRGDQAALHPNTFIQRAQELAERMATVLHDGGSLSINNNFSREEGLQICLRLQGFGLAHEIATEPRQVPITNYSARLTPRGMMLLKLLGETVPNWSHYFDDKGTL